MPRVAERKKKATKRGAYKPQPQRALRRVTVRVRPDEEQLIAALCQRLEVRESELVRRAIHALAQKVMRK